MPATSIMLRPGRMRPGPARCMHRAEGARMRAPLPQFRAGPGDPQALLDLLAQRVDRDSVLREAVAVAERDRAVLERLVVDRHRPGGADLVLSAVAAPDRAALVVLALHALAQLAVDLGRELGLAVLA